MLDYECLLESLGGFGWYQLYIYFWTLGVNSVTAANMGYMTFARLAPPDDWHNSTNQSLDNQIQFYSVAMEWDLTGPMVYIPALMISVQMAGILCGVIVNSQLSDRLGRRPAFLGAFAFLLASSIIASFSSNWQMFLIFRYIVGVFMGASMCVSFVWATEVLLPRHRLILQIGSFPLGYIVGALIARSVRHWKYTLLWTQLPAPVTLLMTLAVEESPKWLLEKGYKTRAVEVLTRIAKWNRTKLSNILEHEHAGIPLTDKTDSATPSPHPKFSYWHLFHDKRATQNMIALLTMWTETALVYFGVIFNLGDLAGDVFINSIYVYTARLIVASSIYFLDANFTWLGRRFTMLIGVGCASICFGFNAIALMTKLDEHMPRSLTISSIIGISSLGIQWAMCTLCSVELIPTLVRNVGYGLGVSVSRIGGILAPQIFLLYSVYKPAPYIVLTVMSIICWVVVYFLLPETKGKPLPDLPPHLTGLDDATSNGTDTVGKEVES